MGGAGIARRGGRWTERKRAIFLDALATSANVSASAESVRMSSQSAYKLRLRDAAFRAGWNRALAEGVAQLELMMIERALIGEKEVRIAIAAESEPLARLATLSRYSNRVATTLLRSHRPAIAAADRAHDDAATEALRENIRTKLDALARRLAREAEDGG